MSAVLEILSGMHPILQALLAAGFTYLANAFGAATVFFTRSVPRYMLDGMLGFAGGVMIAASVWSLLIPAIDLENRAGRPGWLTACAGFLAGGVVLWAINRILPHVHIGYKQDLTEGPPTRWRRTTLLILALTVHNIPEGMAVGVAFGAVAAGIPEATLPGAAALALGIGIQNFPEGMAVSVPLRREGMGVLRSFWYGQLSGAVEPLAAVFGAALVFVARPILPYALSFAAGSMIFVVMREVIPESQAHGHAGAATAGGMIGFALMMVLDTALG